MNDNRPRHALSFTSLAERREFLASAPDTHANYRPKNCPAARWLIAAKDERRLDALKFWQHMNDAPQLCANDNNPTWPDGRPLVTQMNTEMETYSAEQLIYAYEHGMVRMVGNRLVKVWNGFKWVGPDEEFKSVRQAADPKVDAMYFQADAPDAEAEQARAMEADRLRAALGAETCAVLDMAAGDSTLQEIGESLGYTGKYAQRKGVEATRDAIDALLAA